MSVKMFCYFVMKPDGSIAPLPDGDDWKKFSCLPLFQTQRFAEAKKPFGVNCWLDEIELEEALQFVLDGHVRTLRIFHDKGMTVIDDVQARELLARIRQG